MNIMKTEQRRTGIRKHSAAKTDIFNGIMRTICHKCHISGVFQHYCLEYV